MQEVTTRTKFQALYIDPVCRKKIQYWANAASGEVSGLGLVENEDGRMTVSEVFILEQECTGADTELNTESISKLMTELLQNDKDPAKLKFWWHSHVNMGVFWSGTDDECAETLSREFAFSTVVNKKGESKTRLDLYSPFRITVDNIRLVEITQEDEDLKKVCEQEVKDKVEEKSWGGNWNNCGKGRGYYDHKNRNDYNNYNDYAHGYGSTYHTTKVKLKDEVVEDIRSFVDLVYEHGHSEATMKNFAYELTLKAAKEAHKAKAMCQAGAGTYNNEDELCKKCTICTECCVITSKLEQLENEKNASTEYDGNVSKDDIEIVVDGDS